MGEVNKRWTRPGGNLGRYTPPAKKKAAPKKSGGGGGSSSAPTKFEQLAKKKGVDLPAEQIRAKKQIETGQKIGGKSSSTIQAQRKPGKAESNIPLRRVPVEGSFDPGRVGKIQPATPYEKFAMTQFGQSLSGFKQGATFSQDIAGRDLKTLSTSYIIGNIVGMSSTLLSLNILAGTASKIGHLPVSSTSRTAGKATAAAKNAFAGWSISGSTPGLTGTGVVANTATAAVIKSAAGKVAVSTTWKVLGSLGVAFYVAKEILELTLGGKVFGQFIGQEEASQTINIAGRDALMAGDIEGYRKAAAARDEVLLNNTFWNSTGSLIPYKNVLDGLDNYRSLAITAGQIYDKLADDMVSKATNGETKEDYWAKRRIEEIADNKAMTDYHSEIRREDFLFEQDARLAARKAKNADEKKIRNDEAQFWANHRARERELEAADRKAIADFWIAYRKTAQKISENNRPSNLNFGLL